MAEIMRSTLARLRHDLRTPLNAIIGYSDVLLEELGPDCGPDAAAALQGAAACGHRLLTAVTRTLTEVEQESGADEIPEGLHLRLARVMAHDVEALREELARLDGNGVPQADIDRLYTAVDQLWSFCTHRHVPSSETRAPTRPAAPRARPGIGGRVLIVDDLAENRELLQRRLQLMGHETRVAASGPAAFELLDEEGVDLILLDVLMPGMDGLEVLRRIRADARLRHIPVIMLSAMDADAHVVRCIELGADDYVSKPFNPVFLRARVGATLEKKRLRDAEEQARLALDQERARVEDLLRAIMPSEIVAELMTTGEVRPRRYDDVAVLFCDVVDFTRWCDAREPEEVVTTLRAFVERLEDIAQSHGLQKIKTIGDSFMAVAGMLRATQTPALDCVRAGLEMLDAARVAGALGWRVRVGVHVGPVVAGIVGRTQYLFDLWGDTVNTAARVESHGEADAVCVSDAAWVLLEADCIGSPLPPVHVKGKGVLPRWRVDGVRA